MAQPVKKDHSNLKKPLFLFNELISLNKHTIDYGNYGE